jgi:hypothetical protein
VRLTRQLPTECPADVPARSRRRTGLTGWRSGYELSVNHSTARAATSGEVEALAGAEWPRRTGICRQCSPGPPGIRVEGTETEPRSRNLAMSPIQEPGHEPDPGTWP